MWFANSCCGTATPSTVHNAQAGQVITAEIKPRYVNSAIGSAVRVGNLSVTDSLNLVHMTPREQLHKHSGRGLHCRVNELSSGAVMGSYVWLILSPILCVGFRSRYWHTFLTLTDPVCIELRKLAVFRELPGLVLNPKMEFGKNDLEWCWDWGWGSFKCRCQGWIV